MREDSIISLYRGRLDDTLSSHDLTNAETLRALVKDQIVRSSNVENEDYIDKIVETRTKEVANFLAMLRSASVSDGHQSKNSEVSHGSWKLKQDTEEFRVMYREGPEGTPFHTLLVEGYVDGPLDACLCISWEAGLYPKWWPKITVPTFRILSSECLQKIRINEQICLVRMKLSWPLSTREAILHYFEFEHFQDDLVVVLWNSISDLENIDLNTHGFTRDGIPDPQDVIRIDVVGGFALQKVSAHRSYFRTIANMDIKLDFVPPAFINFVSRQLVGSGFKLYKKKVASVSKGDEDFGNALKDPLYTRVGEALYSKSSTGLSTIAPQPEELKNDSYLPLEEQSGGKVEVNSSQEIAHNDDLAVNSQSVDSCIEGKKSHSEIEEVEENDSKQSACLAEDDDKPCSSTIDEMDTRVCVHNQSVVIRPEVEHALHLLDEVISVFHEYRSNDETKAPYSLPGAASEESPHLELVAATESLASEPDQICKNAGAFSQSTKRVEPEPEPDVITTNESRNSSASPGSRCTGCSTYCRDANHSRIAPASPDDDVSGTIDTHHTSALLSPQNRGTELSRPEKIGKEENVVMVAANGFGGNKGRRKNLGIPNLCCFGSISWQ